MSIDPIRLELIRNSLISTAEEMEATVSRTAYNVIIYEANDFVCGVVDPEKGELVAGSIGVPQFLGCLPFAVDATKKNIGEENLEEGDIIICNDPYQGGGTHGNDFVSLHPIFSGSHLVSYCVFKGHVLDTGGLYEGGHYNETTEIFQECFRLPPVKLYRKGIMDGDIVRTIRSNSRFPDSLMGDLRASVSAVKTGARRVLNLIDRYGYEQYHEYTREILGQAEEIARKRVSQIPKGKYESECYLDGDGMDGDPHGQKLLIHLELEVKDDRIIADLTKSCDQSPGSLNSARPNTYAFTRYGFKMITTPDYPLNDGSFRPLTIKLREGSILDPVPPAATSLFFESGQTVTDLFLKALAPAMPDKIRAGIFGSNMVFALFGIDARKKRKFAGGEAFLGGWGGKPHEDGVTLYPLTEGRTTYPMVELSEVLYPIRFRKLSLANDSAGPGKYRGGLGAIKEIEPLCPIFLSISYDRDKYSPPWGLFGGKPGRGRNVLNLKRGKAPKTTQYHKIGHFALYQGDVLTVTTRGGGGYGSPSKRSRVSIYWDVINEYISAKSAESDYGVKIDKKLLEQMKSTSTKDPYLIPIAK